MKKRTEYRLPSLFLVETSEKGQCMYVTPKKHYHAAI